MGANSKIQWTTHTFNPWRGCTKVSAGCALCYAETQSKRNLKVLGEWGPNGTRVVASESKWREPLAWDRAAKAAGERHRVFCASFADVFEDWQGLMSTSDGAALHVCAECGAWRKMEDMCHGPIAHMALTMGDVRRRLFALVEKTPHLDWLLLTKRPRNVLKMTHDAWCKRVPGHVSQNAGDGRRWSFPPNVWVGASVENQKAADERIPELLKVPASVRFLSCEPLLGPVNLGFGGTAWATCNSVPLPEGWRDDCPIGWVIVGGESGSGRRELRVEWVRSLVRQCKAAGVPAFVKQLGHTVVDCNDHFGGASDFGDHWPDSLDPLDVEYDIHGFREDHQGADCRVKLRDGKGGDPAEWPSDLRVRQFPQVEAP